MFYYLGVQLFSQTLQDIIFLFGTNFMQPPCFSTPVLVASKYFIVSVFKRDLLSVLILYKLLKTLSTLAFEKGRISKRDMTFFKLGNKGTLAEFFRLNMVYQYCSASFVCKLKLLKSNKACSLHSVSNVWILSIQLFNTGKRFTIWFKDCILKPCAIYGSKIDIYSKIGSSNKNLRLILVTKST